jgi:glycosyltransferase involved in cell wall biosynthesis
MPIKHLVYLANIRLPTEKAHGYQICQMCQAFAQQGVEVSLLHPRRRQVSRTAIDPRLKKQTVFEYYGLENCFQVRSLPNWDWVVLNLFIPDVLFAPIFFLHSLLWGLYAVWVARRMKAELYYTRDTSIAFWLGVLNLAFVYEAHGLPKRGQRWLLQKIARFSALQGVVVLTSFLQKGLVELGFAPEKVLVQPDGVNLSLFTHLPAQPACRQQLQLPIDRFIIGYIGRFRAMAMEKGISELVAAIAQLPPGGQEPLLLCVGGPMDAVPTYQKEAEQMGLSARYLQFRDRVPNTEVPLWIKACDVVTIPWTWTEFSAYFTSPMKLFEYMAAGGAIVASDLPALREVLTHAQNAWLVEPGNPDALAQGIATLLHHPDLKQQLQQQAQRDVQAYTWNGRARQILAYLELSS